MKLYSDAELAQILDKDIFHQIGNVADTLGVECYVVGGFVRDIFLERPSNDIDVVVVGSGIRVAEELKKRLGKRAHLSVFKNFGTAQVKIKGKVAAAGSGVLEIEFVGARKESYSHDSRKPIVEDGTLEDDQNRRDFTINACAICLNAARFGELVDPFDGIYDMEDGIIRTPLDPDITFSDDPLRMLRCVRFATQLRFDIEPETKDALRRNAHRLEIISGERIADELNKIMLAQHPSIGLLELHESGLLHLILPELTALDIVETRNGRSHKNNFYHTLEVLENVCKADRTTAVNHDSDHTERADDAAESTGCSCKNTAAEPNLWLRWAALLHDIGKTKTKRWEPLVGWTFHNHNYIGAKMVPVIFRRLKLPLDAKMKYVQKLVDLHMRPIVIADEEVTDSAVRRLLNDAGEDIDDLMTLCEADITSKIPEKVKRFLDNFKVVRQKMQEIQEKDDYRNWTPPIDGNEIMERYHLQPSKEVGILREAQKNAILDGECENTREAALAFLDAKAKEIGILY